MNTQKNKKEIKEIFNTHINNEYEQLMKEIRLLPTEDVIDNAFSIVFIQSLKSYLLNNDIFNEEEMVFLQDVNVLKLFLELYEEGDWEYGLELLFDEIIEDYFYEDADEDYTE